MAQNQITMPVWGKAPLTLRAVQGEAQSRIIQVTLTDAGGPAVDLTGAAVRMYVQKPDCTVSFFDGTISDATGGVCSFTLPSGALVVAGKASCQILSSWPDGRSLKAVGLTLEILPSNLEGAAESTSEFSALIVALNKADEAAATATQAAADAQQAVEDAQSAISVANTASVAATQAAQTATTAAGTANTAAVNAQSLYQMIDPTTGQMAYVTNIIRNLEAYIFRDAITAQPFDDLNKSAQNFDALNITALDFDINAKTILGVS